MLYLQVKGGVLMSVGDNIRRFRKEKGWTQAKLAEELQVSQQMIGQFENSKKPPKLETAEKIAAALGVTAFDLMGFDYWDEKYNPNGKLAKEINEMNEFEAYLKSLGYAIENVLEGNNEEGVTSVTYTISGNGITATLTDEEYTQLQSSSCDLIFSFLWKKQK